MPTNVKVKDLKINKLTEAQYDAAVQAGTIGENELSILTDVVEKTIQVDTMPTADASELDNIYQYVGETNQLYTNGYFYKCNPSLDFTGPAEDATEGEPGESMVFALDTDAFAAYLQTKSIVLAGQTTFYLLEESDTETGDSIYTLQDADYVNIEAFSSLVDMKSATGITWGGQEDFTGDFPYVAENTTGFVVDLVYNWNQVNVQPGGGAGDYVPQYSIMPVASSTNEGSVVQYIGTSTADYTHNYVYESEMRYEFAGETDSGSYNDEDGRMRLFVDNQKFTEYLKSKGYNYDTDGGDIQLSVETDQAGYPEYIIEVNNITETFHTLGTMNVITGVDWSGEAGYNVIPQDPNVFRYTTSVRNTEFKINIGYLWKQCDVQQASQFSVMPEATAEYVDRIVQFTGESNRNYKNGSFYKCVKGNEQGEATAVEIETHVDHGTLTATMLDVIGLGYYTSSIDSVPVPAKVKIIYTPDDAHSDEVCYENLTTGAFGSAEFNGWSYSEFMRLAWSEGASAGDYVLYDYTPAYYWVRVDTQPATQVSTISSTDAQYINHIMQYTGETTADYTTGYFYKCTGLLTNPTIVEKEMHVDRGTMTYTITDPEEFGRCMCLVDGNPVPSLVKLIYTPDGQHSDEMCYENLTTGAFGSAEFDGWSYWDFMEIYWTPGANAGDYILFEYTPTCTWTRVDTQPSTTPVITISTSTVVQALASNYVYDCGEMTSIEVTLPSTLTANFASQMNFTSGTTATTFTAPNTIKWLGDDTLNYAFTPVANKRYTVLFYYDGVYMRGLVQGIAI